VTSHQTLKLLAKKIVTASLFSVWLAHVLPQELNAEPVLISIDSASPGRIYEGVGAVSAGASSRLLIDYPEPQRSEILDYLFKPKFGASLQHLKVEIGGGENSTCGSEPSHAITREELGNPKARGYEFWLMAEARKRNPKIILDALPWAFPAWTGGAYTKDSAAWMASFLNTAKLRHGLKMDWLDAAWNELGSLHQGENYRWIVEDLVPELKKTGFGDTKLQAPDDHPTLSTGDKSKQQWWKIFDYFETNPALDQAISAVGYHYLDGREPWNVDVDAPERLATKKAIASGKSLWASEEWSNSGKTWDPPGALYLAQLINKVPIRNKTTKFEIWPPVAGNYEEVEFSQAGLMQTQNPWSGSYTVWPAIWAVAHTTQFVEPGWRYLDNACGQLDPKTWRGSYVTFENPATKDWSMVLSTGDATSIQISALKGLRDAPIHVWKSTAKEQFVHFKTFSNRQDLGTLELEPKAIYTFTTTTGQRKGNFEEIPQPAKFPFPYEQNFDSLEDGSLAPYFSDMRGSFEVRKTGTNGCLEQILPNQGVLWAWRTTGVPGPWTIIGDASWRNYSAEVDVKISGGQVGLGICNRAYILNLSKEGRWELIQGKDILGKGVVKDFKSDDWHHMKIAVNGINVVCELDKARVFTNEVDVSAENTGELTTNNTVSNQAKISPTGRVALISSYNLNQFDNIFIKPTANANKTVESIGSSLF